MRCHWFLLGLVCGAGWCGAAETSQDLEFFEKRVRPLLIQRCGECHSAAKAEENGNLAVDPPDGLHAGGTRGPAVLPGKPDESLLIRAVRYGDPQLQMPPEGKLSAAEIETLSEWIRKGAAVPKVQAGTVRSSRDIDWNTARQFWSFRPLQRSTPPATDRPAGNPVDAWIHAGQVRAGLTGSAEADRRTLLRRLNFDLIGLPPSPEDVEEFLADPRPDAWERQVDRLLASPQFGERWARYWLDLARYVDFTPDWQKNTDRAWIYRDWVVRAFNEDRPFDAFVQMQLAADLDPDADPRDVAGLGFLGVSPVYWKELKLAPSVIEVIVADEWDERLDTVTRTFLGLTVACARCHDHKFDPIPTRDYYALAGVFASTTITDRPLLPADRAAHVLQVRAKVEALQAELKKLKAPNADSAVALRQQLETLRSETPEVDLPLAPVVEDSSVHVLPNGPDATRLEFRKPPRDLPVFRRGNPSNPGEIVPRRFLELFDSTRQPFQQGSGRAELARALVTQAGPLTARVITNRLWLHHFGRGLVRTPGDFGLQGDRPTHPELLDWLASDLTEHSWPLKRLHRLMVTSLTYRQTSMPGAEATAADPENTLLTRMSRRRLEIEPWRDAMLAVAGNLDDRQEGIATDLDAPRNFRRTLYGRIGRDEQHDLLRIFDFPPPNAHSPSRDATTTPLQQLFIYNSDFVDQQAARLAEQILAAADSPTARIDQAYLRLFQRLPSATERRVGTQFLQSTSGTDSDRWKWYLQSLLGLNEFLYID